MHEIFLYEDSTMRVVYRQGATANLICTFGDAAAVASAAQNSSSYNGKEAIEYVNAHAIAFQPKSAHWYPADSMHAAIEKIQATLDLPQFQNIVGYGASMGGYGALKYAKLLGATHVIAYCPQWSIDPEEANGDSPYGPSGHPRFQPSMRGHGVTQHELAIYDKGVYVVYDPRHAVDTFHAHSYRALNDRITLIRLRGANHDIPKILIGRKYFSDILTAVLRDDVDRVRNLVVQKYRANPRRYLSAYQLAVKRHPEWSAKLLSLHAPRYLTAENVSEDKKFEPLVDELIRTLLLQGKHPLAGSIARLQALREMASSRANLMVDRLSGDSGKAYFLRTKYDTLVCYDENRSEFSAHPSEDIVMKTLRPLQLRYYRGKPYLSVGELDGQKVCVMTHGKKIVLREIPHLDGVTIDGYLVELQNDQVSLKCSADDQYCSISPNGVATWDRPWARSNETFKLVSPRK